MPDFRFAGRGLGLSEVDLVLVFEAAGRVALPEPLLQTVAVGIPLLADLGLRVPLMAERGYHVEFPDPGIEIANSVMDVDAKVVASRMEGGVRVAGQAEFAPVDAPPSERRKALMAEVAKSMFPTMNPENPRFWMGRRPSFPDSLPMRGAVEGQPGLHLNFGHSHYGLMMAPKSGEVLAEQVVGGRANTSLEPFSPTRF